MIATWAMRFREQLQESVLEKERGVEVHQFVIVSLYTHVPVLLEQIQTEKYTLPMNNEKVGLTLFCSKVWY